MINADEIGEVRDDAFHITAAANLVAIAVAGFRVDRRGVLGTGAYFDLGTEETGWLPARQRYPGQSLVVFRCEIRLGRVLDLDDAQTHARFRRFQRVLVSQLGRDESLRRGQGGQMDLFLDTLAETGETYDTVKRTFVTDGQTRIAVRSARRILVLSVRDESGKELGWPPTRP